MRLIAFLLLAALAYAQKLPPGAGRATLIKVCGECHAPEVVTGKSETPEEWKATVDEMVTRGAKPTEPQRKAIIYYLTKNFSAQSRKPGADPRH